MFSGKAAIVTGAASGIGLATALHLAEAGIARLLLIDRDGALLTSSCAKISAPDLILREGDIADEGFWDGLADDIADTDLAVLNAGISSAGFIAQLDFAEWRRVLSVNLDGTFLGLRAVMRAMQAHGRGGAMVLTASAAGVKAEPGVAAYGTSKAAVLHLAKVAAKEGAPHNIRVNAIAPGGVETPIWRGVPFFEDLIARTGSETAAFAEMGRMATPLGRYATADEIAAQISFLLSDACGFVTGTNFLADGGYTL